MKRIIKSEWIKQRSNADKKFLFLVPLIAIFVTLLLVGPNILESFSIYWWEAIFLYTLIGLLFLYDYKAEERAGHFQNIYLGGSTIKIYMAKVLLKIKDVLFSSMIFLVILVCVSHFLFSEIVSLSISKDGVCLLLLLLTSVWLFPFLYFLSKWVSPYFLLAINSLNCLLIAPFIAQTSIWYLFPFTYHYKISYSLLHLKPSGDLDLAMRGIDIKTLVITVILSVIAFIISLLLLNWRVSNDQLSKK
ncbi:lantibiotic ABC transporter permease [Streptococcus equi subsp. zooepidemicus]|uniref:lantibiotic ABC transporter permease n=1 Tax=Streptococcus equi TaxID=1336 RepID=UPI001E5A3B67|nr:lantibiotic ABC transporter permease [Streptococcus equi]MCD3396024.1 lantibiotic ABC transporter permease [Streptococcus equi subsp. zooepidemicus]HEL0671110.1 lantibiotic ABC transporter permease [Streptococcus equi subsp. zooepidemicus]HEL0760698.1 lantibiotic ABC transporter permease [Streptococcus equi subsp. zooepidemicus]HEL0820541.1 lantibiotic ABC transporter permease [Streptococcus equi subsp. zooepidemicus]